MHLVLLGPQGCGKGTQAALLVEKFGYKYFAMGNALREKAREDSDEGRLVEKILDEGGLVPNEITDRLIKRFVQENENYIVDGYPRNMGQAEFFDRITNVDKVLVIMISDETAIERLGGRRQCTNEHTFHVKYKPPKQDGVCDECGEPLKQRDDDTEDAIKERLKIFHSKTKEVIDHYADRVVEIDGNGSIEEVHDRIVQILN